MVEEANLQVGLLFFVRKEQSEMKFCTFTIICIQ